MSVKSRDEMTGFWAWYAGKVKAVPRSVWSWISRQKLLADDEEVIGIVGFLVVGVFGSLYLFLSFELVASCLFLLSAPFWVTVYYHGKWRGRK
jgi:hypothetical protein